MDFHVPVCVSWFGHVTTSYCRCLSTCLWCLQQRWGDLSAWAVFIYLLLFFMYVSILQGHFYTLAVNIILWEHLKYNLMIHGTWNPPTWIVTYWRVWSCRLQALVNTCDLNYGLEVILRHSLIYILSGCRDLDSMHSVARFAIRSKWATTFKDSFVLKFLRHTLFYDLVTSITNYMYIDQ